MLCHHIDVSGSESLQGTQTNLHGIDRKIIVLLMCSDTTDRTHGRTARRTSRTTHKTDWKIALNSILSRYVCVCVVVVDVCVRLCVYAVLWLASHQGQPDIGVNQHHKPHCEHLVIGKDWRYDEDHCDHHPAIPRYTRGPTMRRFYDCESFSLTRFPSTTTTTTAFHHVFL